MAGPQGIIGSNTAPAIRGNMSPPRGAVPTGEIFNGSVVYREARRTYKRVAVRDEDGAILYHLRADGSKRAPQYMLVPDEPEIIEYIIEDQGNGMTRRHTGFRPSEGELKAAARRRDRDSNLDRLALALEASNLSVEDIVAAVQSMQQATPVVVPEEPIITPPPGAEMTDAQKRAAHAREARAKANAQTPKD